VQEGLRALASTIGAPINHPGLAAQPAIGMGGWIYYYFWSVERVAVAYGLSTIGGKDWYAWGAEILVARQALDGSWTAQGGDTADTCFALLFLKRANLAPDLSAMLKGRVKDGGETALKATASPPPAIRHPETNAAPTGQAKDAASASSTAPNRPPTPERAEIDSVVARLKNAMVQAPPDRVHSLIEECRDGKGAAYSEALAAAIPDLAPLVQDKARDALAERLMRMNAATLGERIRDRDVEMRIAAARACASKNDRRHVPDLIALLSAPEARVHRAARAALRHLASGVDFGPAPDATPRERADAIDKWKKWWNNEAAKSR
jgi:hypothetical protein